jgi:hypothetical protein
MVQVIRRHGAPTPGVSLMQARLVRQGLKNYVNAAKKVTQMYEIQELEHQQYNIKTV